MLKRVVAGPISLMESFVAEFRNWSRSANWSLCYISDVI